MTTPGPDLARLRINRDAPSGNGGPRLRRALWINLGIALGAVLLIGSLLLVMRRGRAVPVETAVASVTGAAGAGVAGSAAVTANGYVVARTRASVSSKVPGRLVELRVSEGSLVRQGEVIARLENADYAAQVAQADASVRSAQAALVESRTQRDQLVREASRARDIHTRSPELISTQEVEAAESRAAQGEARVRADSARIEAAQAALTYARANLENTLIRAPFTGTVLRKDAEVGEVVAPSVGGGLTRGAVVTMADLTTLEVEVDVNEAYIARIRSEQPARIMLDAYPDTSFRGAVRQVVPTADRQRATVQVKVRIQDRDPRILPEMGARVDFLETDTVATAAESRRIRVPAAAVRQLEGKSVVWIIREEKLEPREVVAGPVSGGYREIRSGLMGGELLLTGGLETPRAGMRVRTGG
jgi:RND family efflux transporter MFP subunit